MTRHLIINADDFGASPGINRGIIEAHTQGVVTSASLMVTGLAAQEAAALSRELPDFSLGLHWDISSPLGPRVDPDDKDAVRDAFARQLDEFTAMVGRTPTHIDSHHHMHRDQQLAPLIAELAAPLDVPLRGNGKVTFIGGFYAQWEWKVTDLYHVSVEFLDRLLRDEVVDRWTEISCHPGYAAPGFDSTYTTEREAELRTLSDWRIKRTVEELGISLANYADYLASALD